MLLRQAYQMQREALAPRMERGEMRAGVVATPARAAGQVLLASLTSGMLYIDGGTVKGLDIPGAVAAPGVAMLLRSPVVGALGPLTAQVRVEAVAAALVFSAGAQGGEDAERLASNLGCRAAVIGPWTAPAGRMDNRGVLLGINGHHRVFTSSAVFQPQRILSQSAALADSEGMELQDGWVVIAVAPDRVTVEHGDSLTCEVQGLGTAHAQLGE